MYGRQAHEPNGFTNQGFAMRHLTFSSPENQPSPLQEYLIEYNSFFRNRQLTSERYPLIKLKPLHHQIKACVCSCFLNKIRRSQ